MVLVGVVSDTHDRLEYVRRASKILLGMEAELVLHLGDIIAPFTLKAFKESGVDRLIAVFGNNCGEKPLLIKVAEALGYRIETPPYPLEINGARILMMHGSRGVEETVLLAESLALSGKYDVVLYGHTHKVDVRRLGKTLLLNPGEACGYLSGRATVALLDLAKMHVEIIEI